MPLHDDIARTETNFDVKASMNRYRLVGLWRLMRGYRPLYVGAILTIGLAAIANTATLMLLRYLVDDVLLQPDAVPNFRAAVLNVALAFIVLTVFRGGFSFLSGTLAAQTAEGIALRLKDFAFDHLQHLSFLYHDKMQTGELIQRVTSDIDALRRFFAEQAIGIGRIVFLFIVNFVALLMLHWQLAIISVIVIPVIIMLSLFFFGKLSKAWDEFQTQEGKLSAALQENLSGVRVVKAFARQQHEVERFEHENKERYRLGVRFTMMHSAYWPITDMLTGAQAVLGYYLAAMLVINNGVATLGPITLTGEFTLGMFIAYSAMIWWIIEPVRNLGRLIVQMSTGLVSYDRVMEIIREDRELIGKDDPAPIDNLYGNIIFENVSFAYEDGQPVLKDISFEVTSGQTIALLGSTGSGKTSLVSLLPRFYDYDAGSIRLEGNELRDYPKRFLRANIGIVEQEPFLFSRTIRENITYGVPGEVSDEDVIKAAKAAAVHEVIMTFPDAYQTMVGERGVTLSGGQKQRIALARTLLKNPQILILDDATSSVDTRTEYAIREALNTLMQNRTSFIIAHRIQSVMTADLILVMDKGEIVQRGTHDSLMLEDGIYRQTYDMQARIEEELEKELADV